MLEWKQLWDAMDAQPEAWVETTENMFWRMLEALPPRAHIGGAFLVGEPRTTNDAGEHVYAAFHERKNGTFFAKHLTYRQFIANFGA